MRSVEPPYRRFLESNSAGSIQTVSKRGQDGKDGHYAYGTSRSIKA